MVLIFALLLFSLDKTLHIDPHEINTIRLVMLSPFGLVLGNIGKRVDKLTADIMIWTYRARLRMA
jgi:hypothetical protein